MAILRIIHLYIPLREQFSLYYIAGRSYSSDSIIMLPSLSSHYCASLSHVIWEMKQNLMWCLIFVLWQVLMTMKGNSQFASLLVQVFLKIILSILLLTFVFIAAYSLNWHFNFRSDEHLTSPAISIHYPANR